MRRGTRHLLVGSVVAAMGVAGTLTAFADWSTPGTVTAKARTAKMPRGVQPSVAKRSKAAVVSWSAQQIGPDARMDKYVVTAHSLNSPPLPDVTHTVTATGGQSESVTFAATDVSGGTWQWTITPGLHRWLGAESRKSSRLTFAAPAGQAKAGVPATDATGEQPASTVDPPAATVDQTPAPDAVPDPPKQETEPTAKPEPTPKEEATPDATETSPASKEPATTAPTGPDLTE